MSTRDHPRASLLSVCEVGVNNRRTTKLQPEDAAGVIPRLQLAVLARMPISMALPLTV